jgi:6-phosphogluconolactonase
VAPPNLLFIGTYTDTIHTLRLDAKAGKLSEAAVTPGVANPSYLLVHPTGDWLYAVNELSDYEGQFGGAVSAYRIEPSGSLTLLNTEPTHGADPCHLQADPSGRFLVVVNYTSGHVTVLPILPDGRLAPARQVIAHSGASAHPTRQTSPHPHHIAFHAAGRQVLVTDLGLDQIISYRFDPGTGLLEREGEPARATPGAGPRQAVSHPATARLYVLNELTSSIAIYDRDRASGRLTARDTLPTLPGGVERENSGAELQLAPSGRFLYASNRGHDSIAIFSVDPLTGDLMPGGHVSTLGATPRQFEISPDGRFLAAANQDGDNVVLFRVNPDTGALTATGSSVAVPRPVCVKFTPFRKAVS